MVELHPNQIPNDLKKYFEPKRKYGSWILRNKIIWYKPNCMPSSASDRFTVDFEMVYFFVKNKKYYFEQQLEHAKVGYNDMDFRPISEKDLMDDTIIKSSATGASMSREDKFITTRNKRCVWKITTKPFKGAHFAVFPEALIETPIKAGCPENSIILDPFMGSGTTARVALKNNRNYIGIELNQEYIDMSNKELRKIPNTKLEQF